MLATFLQINPESTRKIGKTRHVSLTSRGVLRLPPQEAELQVSRRQPSAALASFVAYYWRVSWDLRDRPPHLQETLPHPNVYLVFEDNRLQLSGVSTGKFIRNLTGESFAFGVKFKAGGFRPFLNAPVASLTDRIVAANTVFGPAADELETTLVEEPGEDNMVSAVDAFLLARAPARDENVSAVDGLVSLTLRQPEIRTVENLVEHTGINKRTLQRLFREYVGVPPKWVIRRYRLHELVARLEAGDPLNWPDLALDLGYFDQAHLINDFRAVTGYSPADYLRR